MASHPPKNSTPVTTPLTPDEPVPAGPQSGIYFISTQYLTEQSVRSVIRTTNSQDSRTFDEALEVKYRLRGVQFIDKVREAIHLPIRTFDTAATYYHKFRIRFPSSEYNYEDAALASLFVACKVEDTIKKSREILCAAHNIRQPHDQKSSDDKTFETHSKCIVGLERHILETIGFDFRGQYPQKLLFKMIRRHIRSNERKRFQSVAYNMSIDLYKTFAPIKQTTSTLACAVFELTATMTDIGQEVLNMDDLGEWSTSRACLLETMQDLLNLYTQSTKSTKVGGMFGLDKLMDIKIEINKMEKTKMSQFETYCRPCAQETLDLYPTTPGSASSPAATVSVLGSGNNSVKRLPRSIDGATRFIFDAEEARREQTLAAKYVENKWEEYEEEVDEPEPRSGPARNHAPSGPNSLRDHGWGPYHRNRNDHHGRHKGRKGGYLS